MISVDAKIAQLEALTGHRFKDIAWLERAVSHRSWIFEVMPDATDSEKHEAENESLEFIGDSVLGLVIAEQLYRSHPGKSEGALTLMKHHLVSTATLARLAGEIELGRFVRMGKGEERTGGRKKSTLLANTLEAVIGAVFLDGGYTAARVFVSGIFAEDLKNSTPDAAVDFKSMLQETLQAEKLEAPRYNVIRTEGPPHQRVFFVEAVWTGGSSGGSGSSRKAAEMQAAAAALEIIRKQAAAATKDAAPRR